MASAQPSDDYNVKAADAITNVALSLNDGEAPGSVEEWSRLVDEAVATCVPCEEHEDDPLNIKLLPFATSMQSEDLVWQNEERKAAFSASATSAACLFNVLLADGTFITWCPSQDQATEVFAGQSMLHAHFDDIKTRAYISPGSDADAFLATRATQADILNYRSWRVLQEANEVMRETDHRVRVVVVSGAIQD